ncbi:hypothetical protein C1645_776756 [Glomus cerebriforme]|uniref:Uncharacterized protein n=1 Tax=Glomus cerebriforme TaxID=658196 RepID=A0A397SXQ0_9GLOM|nr:hypothetical protein C1645_776756 [Glomus cerebriforme]
MIDYAGSLMNFSSMYSRSTLQNSWFSLMIQQLMNMSYPKISLLLTPSSSADCKKEEQPSTEGKEKKRKKVLTARKNKKRKKDENINRILKVKLYPNLMQKRLLKR